jgi:hypothetical protein
VSSNEEILIDRYTTPVFYFPPTAPWSTVDNIVAFRVLSPEAFALGFSAGVPVSNLVLAVLSVVLFRRGLRRGSAARSA